MTKPRSVASTANDNSFPGSRLEDGSITQDKIASSVSLPIADGSITDAKISPSAGISATKLDFVSAGTVGAVERTVQSKLRESVSVLDYIPVSEHAAIASNTSTYDCAQAIRNALKDSFEVFFPAGTYNIESTVTISWKEPGNPSNTGWGRKTLRGVRDVSVIRSNFAGAAFHFDYRDGIGTTGLGEKKPVIENLDFRNADPDLVIIGPDYDDVIALLFNYPSQGVVRQCRFFHYRTAIYFGSDGVGNGANYMHVQSCYFQGLATSSPRSTYAAKVDTTGGTSVCAFFINCVAQNCGYDLRGMSGGRIMHSDISNPCSTVYLGDGQQIVQCYAERFNVNGTTAPTPFPWFILGDDSHIRDSVVTATPGEMGVQQLSGNALFKFEGKGSSVENNFSAAVCLSQYFDDLNATGLNYVRVNTSPPASAGETGANQRGLMYRSANKTKLTIGDRGNFRNVSYNRDMIGVDGTISPSECLLSVGQPAVLTNLSSVCSIASGSFAPIDIPLPLGRSATGAYTKITSTAAIQVAQIGINGGTMSLSPNTHYASFFYLYVPSSSVVTPENGVSIIQLPSNDSPNWGVTKTILAYDQWVPVPSYYLMTSVKNSLELWFGNIAAGGFLYIGEVAIGAGLIASPYQAPYSYP